MRVCLDSRLIQPGDYFVPVKGESFDGHRFIDQAKARGATGIIEETELYKLVIDKLTKTKPQIIGVTGSSGKSTTTYYLHQILSTKFISCLGNLNTKLGLSVNVINDMPEDCQIFVAEMGMDRAGELSETTKLFPLDMAVITTINHVHVEKLGSMDKLVKAKGEIIKGIKPGGLAILNEDNPYIKKLGKAYHGEVIWFNSKPLLNYPQQFLGDFSIRNLNVCTIIGRELGLSDQQILDTIDKIKVPKGRLHILEGINGSIIIDDSYNANPESVKYALDVLTKYPGKRKVAILGDMLELGRYKIRDHREIGQYINELGTDIFIGVGQLAKEMYTQIKNPLVDKFWLANSDRFQPEIFSNKRFTPLPGDVILIKGSQGKRMEVIVKDLMLKPDQAAELLVRQDARWASATSVN